MPSLSSNPPIDPSAIEQRIVGSLPSAILLAITGGSLDAFVYLNHGHVFAAAMTGNGVLFGIAVLHHDLGLALRHFAPILAFVFGVFAAKALDLKLKRRHAITVGLLGEITVLFAASWLPGSVPDLVFVPILALAGAYQITSFRTVNSYAYNSTFMTGNLRTAMDGLFDALTPSKRRSGLRKFRDLSLIVAAFLLGATAGAILAPRLYNHTLWFIDLPLVAVLFLALALDRSRSEALAVRAVESPVTAVESQLTKK
jgi:uncharacterized membrane protein YoaK (UPF0700 family)